MLDLFNFNNIPNVIHIKVTPKAKVEKIKPELQANNTMLYKVYVHAEAQDGKANEAVIKLLSEALNVPKSALKITHGLTTRFKICSITHNNNNL
jgi:uncharacterized protein YggU (UPF0235/DUF167 family)